MPIVRRRLLLVEDEDELAEFLGQGLCEEGFDVQHVKDGLVAGRVALSSSWDLIILDWWLPGQDGLTLLVNFRQTDRTTPVLFLTARDAVPDRVQGLRAGADDYLCKPFAFDELLARVEGFMRRKSNAPRTEWRYEDTVFDVASNIVRRAGTPLSLTARERSLLLFFLQHSGEALSRTVLYEHVWHEPYFEDSNTLEVHVMELRRKLEAHGPRLIHSVRGYGYRLGTPTTHGNQ
jgi:two-component system copper resistance phosphate regulon response regulator CusR